MSSPSLKSSQNASASAGAPRLFVLEINAGRIHSMNTDGSDRKTIVSDCHLPDGIVVDAEAGHVYWTNMGIPNLNDGSVERADIDGKNRKVIVAKGVTHSPKQIILDKKGGKLYWCDREGMRVMRCNLDGSKLETLIETGRGEADSRDATRWCVGLTIDPKFGHLYWSQKGPDNAGLGRISRANLEIPDGQTAANRSDIEIFFDDLPEPIDLELDLAKGLQVVATDIAPNAEAALRKFVETAWPALKRLGLSPGASQSNLKFTADIAQALAGADLVQENGPERIDFKQKLYGQLDELLPPEVIIASSSSGLTMSEIQKGAASHPERCVIGHPFNPPHLIPLTQIVAGAKPSDATIRRAAGFYTSIGQRTVRVNKEMPGHVANRLQAALSREIYYLVAEGVVSAADVDTALSWGPGLRWGVMGGLMLNHLGGGPGGIEHFFQQFTGPMTAWWKTLGSPVLTPELQKKLIDSVHAEVGSRTIEELEAHRDEVLLGLRELRTKAEKTPATPKAAARAG